MGVLPVTLFMVEDSLVSIGASEVVFSVLDTSKEVVDPATELSTLAVLLSRAELVGVSTVDLS